MVVPYFLYAAFMWANKEFYLLCLVSPPIYLWFRLSLRKNPIEASNSPETGHRQSPLNCSYRKNPRSLKRRCRESFPSAQHPQLRVAFQKRSVTLVMPIQARFSAEIGLQFAGSQLWPVVLLLRWELSRSEDLIFGNIEKYHISGIAHCRHHGRLVLARLWVIMPAASKLSVTSVSCKSIRNFLYFTRGWIERRFISFLFKKCVCVCAYGRGSR